MDLKFKDNNKLKLAKFTKLEYIESTGTQYIDTGYKPNNNTRVVCEFNDLNHSAIWLFGAQTANVNSAFAFLNGSSIYQGIRYGAVETDLAVTHNAIQHLDANKNVWTLENTTKTVTNSTFNCLYNMLIFGVQINGTVTPTSGAVRFYTFKVYDNDILVRDFIPCITDLNTPGMYDTVSAQFFYNQGTGDFVAGPVVSPGIPYNILLKTTTLYHKNTPNVDGLQLLSIFNAQETAGNLVLNRVRVDIGNVSGSLTELMQYAGMAGFNDNYEPQEKPRLVGTWTINNWYTQEQLAQVQDAFDGLTIVGDPNWIINFEDLAVQVIDNTKPNYNPAVAIIMQWAGLGVIFSTPPISGQTGRWFITKNDVALITGFDYFKYKTTVIDTNHIVSTIDNSYDFREFPEFKYFTGVAKIGSNSQGNSFAGCSKLKYLEFPDSNLTTYPYWADSDFDYARVVINHRIHIYNDRWLNSGANLIFHTKIQGVTLESYSRYNRQIIGTGNKYDDLALKEVYLKTSWQESKMITFYDYAAPQIIYDGTDVTISTQRTSIIYYTTDGTTPTKESTQYTSSFAWDGTGVIKAVAIETIDNVDYPVYAEDFYSDTTSNPIVTFAQGKITIAAEQDATVYYTLDGTYPTYNSMIYVGAIDVALSDKIRCFATNQGKNNSDVVEYDIEENIVLQTVDSNVKGYNPAVSIKFEQAGYGEYMDSSDKTKGWYMTQSEADTFTTSISFNSVKTITDTNGICGTIGTSYNFSTFNEFVLFRNVTTLPNSCFYDCTNLTSILLPNSITEIGNTVFRGITLSELTLPDNLVCKSYYNFNSAKINTLIIGEHVNFTRGGRQTDSNSKFDLIICKTDVQGPSNYDNSAFRYTSYNFDLKFPEGATVVPKLLFSHCATLKNIDIASTVTSINEECFDACTGVVSITIRATTPPSLHARAFNGIPADVPIYVPANSVASYQSAANWSARASYIQAIPTT